MQGLYTMTVIDIFKRLAGPLATLGLSGPALAGSIVNGGFSSDLSGWSTGGSGGSVQWSGSQAVLSTGSGASPLSAFLVQGDDGGFTFGDPILIAAADQALKFDAVFTDLGLDATEATPGGFTDELKVWLYDADGLGDLLVAAVSAATLAGPAYSFDLTGLAGRRVALSFELTDEDDGRDSRVSLDNIRIEQSISAVPEPGSLALLALGLAGLPRRGRKG